ncbi:hypothetical protein FHS30_002082 [Simiduia aestuariiviva]|uniref:Uncharacterized protein n=2 Tax=Simiduia aestuariiviva TaxID=1510459 RepID=A0A839UL42_9GAMM|nr:DUF6702 family protein [Simiduia aestuariiviva]MBB3168874.1 hypothetical protein [Simiduia aestuariiviva]
MKTAITQVLFNARSGNVEIMHRFYVHDAEHALSKIVGRQIHLLDDAGAQQQFARYVSAHFAMGLGEPKPTSLNFVGQEVDGKFIWVYQELPIPAQLTELWFRFDALQDHWPEQINQINLEGLGKVRSLQFTREHDWQVLRVESQP